LFGREPQSNRSVDHVVFVEVPPVLLPVRRDVPLGDLPVRLCGSVQPVADVRMRDVGGLEPVFELGPIKAECDSADFADIQAPAPS
jgi:hypothetical protein